MLLVLVYDTELCIEITIIVDQDKLTTAHETISQKSTHVLRVLYKMHVYTNTRG
jgi:hypothetical protein